MAAISRNTYLNDVSQFDYARKKAAEQSAVNLQNRRDAMTRRFAALGNLDSGARVKLEERAANEEAANLNNANEGINAQQNAELGRRREVLQAQDFSANEAAKGRTFTAEQAALQRKYQTGERTAGQQFSGAQAEAQRKFQTGERLSSQDFAALQAAEGRNFATSERQAGQQFASGEAQKQRDIQKDQFEKTYGMSLKQYESAIDQFEKTFAEEVRINNENIKLAREAMKQKGFLENLGSGLSDANPFKSGGAIDTLFTSFPPNNVGGGWLMEQLPVVGPIAGRLNNPISTVRGLF